jgi:hypothetical protein
MKHPTMDHHARLRMIAVLELATGIGLLVYWVLFFTVGLAPRNPPVGYFQFEHSFAAPDIVLALAFIRAGILLRGADPTRHGQGVVLSLVCAGAVFFLGVLDISFNLQNGLYTGWWGDAVLAISINGWCFIFGSFLAFEFGFKEDTAPV